MIKLMPFQKKGVRQIEKFKGRALLADEMGLGKSYQALQWCKNHPEEKPILIICPASLKWVWEIFVHTLLKKRAMIAEGRMHPKKGIRKPPKIIIINYEFIISVRPSNNFSPANVSNTPITPELSNSLIPISNIAL